MTTATVEIDLVAATVDVTRPAYTLDVTVDAPSVDVGIPGPPGPAGFTTNRSIMEFAGGDPINDGIHSASDAITAALAQLAPGTRLWFPPGVYLDDLARTITKPIAMVGDAATIRKGATPVAGTWWLLNSGGVKLQSLTFDDAGGAVTGTLINTAGSGLTGIGLDGCTITAPAAIAFRAAAITDLQVRDNTFTACKTAVWVVGNHVRPEIRNNRIRGWSDRGIYVAGDAGGASLLLRIVDNTVSDMVYNGASRYPITIQQGPSPALHTTVLVEGNNVHGGGRSYNDPTTKGNADCYGLFGCDGLRVVGNLARDGGDMGITLDSTNPIRSTTVVGNVCVNNDSSGIAITDGARDVTIVGNVCKNNGQNRAGDRLPHQRAGIYHNTATNVTIAGNTLGDDQPTKTQQYGVTLASVTNASLGPDVDGGNALGLYFKQGTANVGIVRVSTAALP
jgi:hypothetical protein